MAKYSITIQRTVQREIEVESPNLQSAIKEALQSVKYESEEAPNPVDIEWIPLWDTVVENKFIQN